MLHKPIQRFIKEFFPKAPNILLFGSSIHSKEFNDIDLLILSPDVSTFTREFFTYENLCYEVLIIPKNKIYSVIELDKEYGIYISIIDNGKIIKDKNGKLREIKTLIKNRQLKSSLLLRKYNLEYDLKQSFNYLRLAKTIEHKEIVFNTIIDNIIDLKLLEQGITSAKKTHHKLKKITEIDPNFLSELLSIKKKYLHDLLWNNLIASLDAIIPIHSILKLSFYSNKYILNETYDNELVVHVNLKKLSENNNFLETIVPLLNSLSIQDYYFFEIKNPSITLLEKGFYIVVSGDKTELKKIVLLLNQILNKSKFSNVAFTYPYQLNIRSFFGLFDELEYARTSNILKKVSYFLKDNSFKADTNVFWFTNIFVGSYINCNLKINEFKKDILEVGRLLGYSFLTTDNEGNNIKKYLFNRSDIYFNENSMVTNVIQTTLINVLREWDLEELPDSKINDLIGIVKIDSLKNRSQLFYLLSKVFMIDPSQLAYVFYAIGLLLENEYED